MGIRIGIVGAGTTVAIARPACGGLSGPRRGAVPSPAVCSRTLEGLAGGCASGTGLTGYG